MIKEILAMSEAEIADFIVATNAKTKEIQRETAECRFRRIKDPKRRRLAIERAQIAQDIKAARARAADPAMADESARSRGLL